MGIIGPETIGPKCGTQETGSNMQYLEQNAAVTITVGPILTVDGLAYVTDDLAKTDFRIKKGNTWGALNSSATVVHVAGDLQGMFDVSLTASDADTVGRIEVVPNKATLMGVSYREMVVTPETYAALITNAAGAANGLAVSGASKKVAATIESGDDADAAAILEMSEVVS
jgi:hypothetical protein